MQNTMVIWGRGCNDYWEKMNAKGQKSVGGGEKMHRKLLTFSPKKKT